MAGESVVINGKAIGVTTSLNNKPTVFNSDTDYVFIGRINEKGVIIAGFRVKLTDLAEDYAGELLQDVQLVIENGENDLTDLTTEKKAELENYTNSTLKSSLDSYTSDKKDEISTYVTTVVLPKFNQDVAEILTQVEDSATEASNAAKNAGDSATAAEESKKAAATSAANAATSEENAEDSASAAEESKKAAATSATNAAASEQNAKKSEENASQSAQDAEQAKNEAQAAARRLPAGIILPFAGLQSKQPQYTLFCDGSEVSRTTYADLFDRIGTTFGAGDGSTTFNLPDLVTTIDGTGDGNYIRYGDWSKLGQKIQDAIRNIRGRFGHAERGTFNTAAWSFYQYDTVTGWTTAGQTTTSTVISQIGLNANLGNKTDNPMAGHASGDDIHPYSIYLAPLITY